MMNDEVGMMNEERDRMNSMNDQIVQKIILYRSYFIVSEEM